MLEELEVFNWRNINHRKICFRKGLNIIIGPNGAGKTSLLEALYFALTSLTKTHNNFSIYKKFGTNFFEINLSIDLNNRPFIINRRYRKNLHCKIIQNNSILYRSRYEVNRFITNSFRIDKNLFYNLIYSGEGEIYKSQFYTGKYPVVEYIEALMGFSKLNKFKETTNQLNNYLRIESKKLEIKINQLDELQVYSEIPTSELTDELNKLKRLQDKLNRDIDVISDKLNELKSERRYRKKIYEKNKKLIENIKKSIKSFYNIELIDLEKIKTYYHKVLDEIPKYDERKDILYSNISKFRENLGKNFGKIEELKTHIQLLENISYFETKKILCPLCEKELELGDLNNLKNKKADLINGNNKDITELEYEIERNEEKLRTLEKKISFLTELKKDIEAFINESNDEKIFEEPKKFDNEIREFEIKRDRLQNEEKKNNKKIQNIETQLIVIKTKIRLRRIENYEQNLKAAKFGLVMNGIIIDSINETIDNFKLDLIHPLINKMIEIGRELFPNDERELSLDKDLLPIMKIGDYNLNFKQLSSGEKTFLLILTKTLIIRYFSTIPFLILDEPIEHLDEDNRNLIIEYLYKLCKDNVIDQLILTTYEESIVRKFLNLDQANIIALDPLET